MKKIILVGILVVVISTVYFYWHHPLGKKAIINGHTINLELAITNQEKERGLGYRDSLASDSGMLFVYQYKDRHGFWMQGMRFALDYIWIDGTTIVDLSENVPAPQSESERPVSLAPRVPVDKILEVNAGIIQAYGIRTGMTVQFTK